MLCSSLILCLISSAILTTSATNNYQISADRMLIKSVHSSLEDDSKLIEVPLSANTTQADSVNSAEQTNLPMSTAQTVVSCISLASFIVAYVFLRIWIIHKIDAYFFSYNHERAGHVMPAPFLDVGGPEIVRPVSSDVTLDPIPTICRFNYSQMSVIGACKDPTLANRYERDELGLLGIMFTIQDRPTLHNFYQQLIPENLDFACPINPGKFVHIQVSFGDLPQTYTLFVDSKFGATRNDNGAINRMLKAITFSNRLNQANFVSEVQIAQQLKTFISQIFNIQLQDIQDIPSEAHLDDVLVQVMLQKSVAFQYLGCTPRMLLSPSYENTLWASNPTQVLFANVYIESVGTLVTSAMGLFNPDTNSPNLAAIEKRYYNLDDTLPADVFNELFTRSQRFAVPNSATSRMGLQSIPDYYYVLIAQRELKRFLNFWTTTNVGNTRNIFRNNWPLAIIQRDKPLSASAD